MNSKYLTVLSAFVANSFAKRSLRRQPAKSVTPPAKARFVPMPLADRLQLAFGAFPNHYGNYLGKREAKPTETISADKRFARLKMAHEDRRRDYRFLRTVGA